MKIGGVGHSPSEGDIRKKLSLYQSKFLYDIGGACYLEIEGDIKKTKKIHYQSHVLYGIGGACYLTTGGFIRKMVSLNHSKFL